MADWYVTVSGGGLHDGTSEANAWTYDEMLSSGSISGGDNVWIKAGSHSPSASSHTMPAGSAGSFVAYRGYTTTIGDLNTTQSQHDLSLDTSDYPVITYGSNVYLTLGDYTTYECLHLDINGTGGTAAITAGVQNVIYGCKLVNNNTSVNANNTVIRRSLSLASVQISNSDIRFANAAVNTKSLYGSQITAVGCLFVHGGDGAITDLATLSNCVAINALALIKPVGAYRGFGVSDCTMDDCQYVVHSATVIEGIQLCNCIAYGITAFFNVSANGSSVVNCSANEVSSITSGGDVFSNNVLTLTADPFVDSANSDYRLNLVSGGGLQSSTGGINGGPIGALTAQQASSGGVRQVNIRGGADQ